MRHRVRLVEWKLIDGFPGYWVSNHGDVWSEKTKRILQTNKTGSYPHVVLRKENKSYTRDIHVLVCTAFVGLRPPNHEVNHKDRNGWNRRFDNLEWVSHKRNQEHIYEHPNHRMKNYTITTPDKARIKINNLMRFCKEHKLRTSQMYGLASGKVTAYKGWNCQHTSRNHDREIDSQIRHGGKTC